MFETIIEELRKGCGKWIDLGVVQEECSNYLLCETCQAELDQTLICEKIANEAIKEEVGKNYQEGYEDCEKIALIEINKEKQKHKDFVEKIKEQLKYDWGFDDDELNDFIAELESEVKDE